MNQIREVQRINQEELSRGIAGTAASWHAKYASSAWIFAGNLDYTLTEGDALAVLSEYGEIEDFHLVRDPDTGQSKGFCFGKYADARSCVLAVDNLCGVELTAGRSLRVDHVERYRLPKSLQDKEDELQKRLVEDNQGLEGHAYEGVELENEFSLQEGQDLFAKKQPSTIHKKKGEEDEDDEIQRQKEKKRKRKEEKREAKESRKRERAQIRQEREERRRENRAKNIQDQDDDSRKDSHHAKKHKRSKRDDKKKRKKSEEHSK